MKKHSIISPSGADRWMECTLAPNLEKKFKDTSSEYADEGTLCHDIGELLLKHKLGLYTDQLLASNLKSFRTHKHYSVTLHDYADQYATFCMEALSEAQVHTPNAIYYVEENFDLTAYIPDARGTGDFGVIANSTMHVIDLKYGKGKYVSVEQNKQAMIYALGALEKYEMLYDIDTVKLTIYQPRMDNISTWPISVNDLKTWAEKVLKPTALKAFNGEGEFKVGDHCGFCKARATCRALADHSLELAKYEFRKPELLEDEEVSDILNRSDLFSKWLTSVDNYALDQAINHNKQWPGYKIVEGRGTRKYIDETKVADTIKGLGFKDSDIYEKTILGITAMEKLIGKKTFTSALTDLIIKPPGKPTLVPVTDKRPEFQGAQSAAQDFADVVFDED